jgi:hypothetical protein
MLLALLASACSTGVHAVNLYSDDPTGGPGENVSVYPFSNLEYFDVHADGLVTLRPAYQDTIALTCKIRWGRSCLMGSEAPNSPCSWNPFSPRANFCSRLVGVPKGSPCHCNSGGPPIAGRAT